MANFTVVNLAGDCDVPLGVFGEPYAAVLRDVTMDSDGLRIELGETNTEAFAKVEFMDTSKGLSAKLMVEFVVEVDSAAKTTAESPKSAIFNIADSVGSESNRFSGLRSLWTTPTIYHVYNAPLCRR